MTCEVAGMLVDQVMRAELAVTEETVKPEMTGAAGGAGVVRPRVVSVIVAEVAMTPASLRLRTW